jgi:hypothetical protein
MLNVSKLEINVTHSLKLLSAVETARMLGIHVITLRWLCRNGLGPPRIKGHKRYYYTRAGLKRWIESGCQIQGP